MGEYILYYYSSDHRGVVPRESRGDLYSLLATAWRIKSHGGKSVLIIEGRNVIFDGEALKQAFARLEELESEEPDRNLIDLVVQVLREMRKQE